MCLVTLCAKTPFLEGSFIRTIISCLIQVHLYHQPTVDLIVLLVMVNLINHTQFCYTNVTFDLTNTHPYGETKLLGLPQSSLTRLSLEASLMQLVPHLYLN
jgi:hypothetical protein